jgi:ADP-ribose pyrophosphatase YjhB (NUDIX family)
MYQIADELRAMANLGLRFAENPYDKERYERVLTASARLIAAVEKRPADEVLAQFEGDLSHISPVAVANAAVFRDGRILLIRREDSGLWALPGGLVDVGETLAVAAQRELSEEAGVQGRATRLLGIWDSRLSGAQTKSQVYVAIFLIDAEGVEPQAGPETTGVGFFAEDSLPELHPGYRVMVPLVFKLHRGEVPVPYFDSPG